MKRTVLILFAGFNLFMLSQAQPARAGDTGFRAALGSMLANVAQRTALSGGLAYVLNDAPSSVSSDLPAYQKEWALDAAAGIKLNPATALFGQVEVGIDNRILRSKFGITRTLWNGAK